MRRPTYNVGGAARCYVRMSLEITRWKMEIVDQDGRVIEAV